MSILKLITISTKIETNILEESHERHSKQSSGIIIYAAHANVRTFKYHIIKESLVLQYTLYLYIETAERHVINYFIKLRKSIGAISISWWVM